MKFEKPELKLVRFAVKDVLTASGNNEETEPQTTTGNWDTPIIP